MVFNINDLLIKPTYDVAFYGEDKIIPIGTDTIALQGITWSGLSELLQAPSNGADFSIEDYPRLFSDVDTLGISNEGDGTRYSRSFEWLSDMSAFVYKFTLSFAVGLSVTAFTSGNHSIDQVRVIITNRRIDGTLIAPLADITVDTNMTNITAINDAVSIIHIESNKPFKVAEGSLVRTEISFISTDTLVATSFEGILPWFFFQEGTIGKTLTESALILHLHPALDHAFQVFRDESITDELDYSGTSKLGVSRG